MYRLRSLATLLLAFVLAAAPVLPAAAFDLAAPSPQSNPLFEEGADPAHHEMHHQQHDADHSVQPTDLKQSCGEHEGCGGKCCQGCGCAKCFSATLDPDSLQPAHAPVERGAACRLYTSFVPALPGRPPQ